MENMEQVELMLLNLPTLVIEEILLHLNLQDRKNIRLTCKRLYELCNSTRICMKEKIIWPRFNMSVLNVQPALLLIGRSCYNLELHYISNRERSIILQFFEVNGAKVRSLVIRLTYFAEGFLEALIISCEDLRSLTLILTTPHDSPVLDYFTLEPNTIIRPTVTYLELFLPKHQPSKYFHRMLSVFPNVKQLKINWERANLYRDNDGQLNLETAQESSAIFDELMECGSNLESLKLDIPLCQLSAKGSRFPEGFSKLKDLSMIFDDYAIIGEPEKWYSCFSNLVSLKLIYCRSLQLVRMLENTQLNYLHISSSCNSSMVLNEESFRALVSSKLKIVHLEFQEWEIEGLPMTVLNFPLEANTTVTDLYLRIPVASAVQLFLMYFCGLVHLSISSATDAILQCIFQYQQNLRSLEIEYCEQCSKEGFCGSKDGRLEYSINNLRKLEHLSISYVSCEVIASDELKNVLNSPSLEYLRIYSNKEHLEDCHCRDAKVRLDLYENLTHLRALRIKDVGLPSQETISLLITNLKHLSYLRLDIVDRPCGTSPLIIINSKELSVNLEDYKYKFPSGNSHYSEDLDRLVVWKETLDKSLCSPKISSYEIDWING